MIDEQQAQSLLSTAKALVQLDQAIAVDIKNLGEALAPASVQEEATRNDTSLGKTAQPALLRRCK